MTDPGFPVGNLVGGGGEHQLPRWLCFKKIVCQNKRIWTLGGHALVMPPGSATGRGFRINLTRLDFLKFPA